MQPFTNVIDRRRYTKTSIVAAKEKTATELDSWKYRHYFELIWLNQGILTLGAGDEQETRPSKPLE